MGGVHRFAGERLLHVPPRAFEAFDRFPAMADSRDRLLELLARPHRGDEVSAIVESDVALTMAVLRRANRAVGSSVTNVPDAVATLEDAELESVARGVEVFGFFERDRPVNGAPERVNAHARLTCQATQEVATRIGEDRIPELRAIALLHDAGKVVLAEVVPGYPEAVHGDSRTPDEWLQRERRSLGTDHAEVGGQLAEHHGLPPALASGLAEHHSEGHGPAAVIRLADLLAHYQQGDPIKPERALAAGLALGIAREGLGKLMYALTFPLRAARAAGRPCPLSSRELEVLRGLASGKVAKQIALDLEVTVSTVRNHLHRIYGKIGTNDRAQAVLTAARQGWI